MDEDKDTKHNELMKNAEKVLNVMVERGQRYGVVDDTPPKAVIQYTMDGGFDIKPLSPGKVDIQRGELITLPSGAKVFIRGDRLNRLRGSFEVEIANKDGVRASRVLGDEKYPENFFVSEDPIQYLINGRYRSTPVETLFTAEPPKVSKTSK